MANEKITLKLRQTYARVYKQCARKYDLAVNHKLVAKNKSIALSIGTAAHAGRAEYLRTFDVTAALHATMASLDAEILAYPSIALKPHTKEKGQNCLYQPCVDCARRMLTEVIAYYCGNFDRLYSRASVQVIAVEMPFEYVLAEYEDLQLVLTGTFDAAIMYGPYFINFEFKTTGKQLGHFFDTEYLSPQHKTYPMALASLFPEKQVYGTVLDAVRKPGATYGPEHDKHLIPVTAEDFAALRRDYEWTLRDIAKSMSDDYWQPNYDNCFTIRGRCEFYPICKSNFSPRVIESEYVVVDDLKQIIEEDENGEAQP